VTDSSITPEYSVILNIASLGETTKHFPLKANAEAREGLARRFNLLSIDVLTADLTAKRIGKGKLIRVYGEIKASIVQACVISGAPVPERIEETIEERYRPSAKITLEVEVSMDAEDPPEPIIDNKIDLGEIVSQYLGVAIHPYPRASGVEVPAAYQEEGDEQPETQKNPFLALAALKKNRD
jgi:uncharacterized metal-binding protein YceD (DUF177 family)